MKTRSVLEIESSEANQIISVEIDSPDWANIFLSKCVWLMEPLTELKMKNKQNLESKFQNVVTLQMVRDTIRKCLKLEVIDLLSTLTSFLLTSFVRSGNLLA